MTTTHTRRTITLETVDGSEASAVRLGVATWTKHFRPLGAGATMTETTGYWEGGSANGLTITFDWPNNDAVTGSSLWYNLLGYVAQAAPNQTLAHLTSYQISMLEYNLNERR